MKKRHNPYNIDDVMNKHNLSRGEAEIKISDLKSKTSGSLKSYIKRYGEELGRKRFEEFKNKCIVSEESLIQKHGEELGKKKWQNYMSTRDSRSLSHYIKKYGEEEGRLKYQDSTESWTHKMSLDGYVEKYGEDEGNILYREMTSRKDSSSIDHIRKKYPDLSEEKILERYEQRNASKDCMSEFYFKEKFGESYEADMIEQRMRRSTVYFRLKELYGEDVAREKYLSKDFNIAPTKVIQHGKIKRYGSVSKSSNSFFEYLENSLGIELSYGSVNKEFSIFDEDTMKTYRYDGFHAPSNTLFEYNGSLFHFCEWKHDKKKWEHAFGVDVETVICNDKQKLSVAEKNGYNVVYIWDFEVSSKSGKSKKLEEIKGLMCI